MVNFTDQTTTNTLVPYKSDDKKVLNITIDTVESQVCSSPPLLNSEDKSEIPICQTVTPENYTAIRAIARRRVYSMVLNPEISYPIPPHKACFLFTHNNQFRTNIFWLVTSDYFTYALCAAIVINCSLMAFDDPLDRDPKLSSILQKIDYFFTGKI